MANPASRESQALDPGVWDRGDGWRGSGPQKAFSLGRRLRGNLSANHQRGPDLQAATTLQLAHAPTRRPGRALALSD